MRIVPGIDEIPAGLRFVATVGIFDGMHRGHREVLRATVRAAERIDAAPLVLTFEPHPETVLRGVTPTLLCDPAEKLARFEAAGVELTVVQRFDRDFSDQNAEDFLDRLRRGRALAGLVMSSESAFGRDRQGTAQTVRRLANQEGWDLVELPVLERAGGRVSSGRIRERIESGRLDVGRRLLGRRYAVSGEVVHGDRRGHLLGYPTANLAFEAPVTLPPDGIYAVRVTWRESAETPAGPAPLLPDRISLGVAALGVRPTFGGGHRLLEVHLLDFDGDLYGTRLRVEFVRYQRGERRFSGADALVRQMGRDAARSREILARAREGLATVMETGDEAGREVRSGAWRPAANGAGLLRVDMRDGLSAAEAMAWALTYAREVEVVKVASVPGA